ncbi:MAG: SWEET family sugar transporter [Acidobacteriota bacterium]|nr:SWEET family sugar transporter [Acidobacteriota bacterium]
MEQIIGFASSFILLLTIGKQVYKQWSDGTSEGVSKWLFLGQITASIGFLIYSIMKNDLVFIVTNGLMVVNSLIGIAIIFYHRRRERKSPKHTAN